jgi:hypothetical protein
MKFDAVATVKEPYNSLSHALKMSSLSGMENEIHP